MVSTATYNDACMGRSIRLYPPHIVIRLSFDACMLYGNVCECECVVRACIVSSFSSCYCCVLLPAAAVDATSSCWCSLLLCLRARSSVCVRVCLCIFCLVCAVNRRHVTFQQQFLFRPIHVQQQQQQLTLLHWLYMCKCKCACLFCSHNTKKRSFNSSRSSSIYTHSRHTIETDFGCLFYRRALLLYCISVSSDKPTYSDRFSFEAARFFSISEILKEKIEQE